MKTEFHPEAYEEMRESARYYEETSPGLGKDFLAAVQETTRQIKRFPKAGPILKGSIRKRLVLGFPFAVLYQIEASKIYIAAVMHQHRRPGYWKDRLRDSKALGSGHVPMFSRHLPRTGLKCGRVHAQTPLRPTTRQKNLEADRATEPWT